jgi:hypothetical protein
LQIEIKTEIGGRTDVSQFCQLQSIAIFELPTPGRTQEIGSIRQISQNKKTLTKASAFLNRNSP